MIIINCGCCGCYDGDESVNRLSANLAVLKVNVKMKTKVKVGAWASMTQRA